MRLILAGMPLRSRTSALASASWSLTPLSITYSNVMRLALESPGYMRQASSNSRIGYLRLSGTRRSRSASVTACSETASMTPISEPTRADRSTARGGGRDPALGDAKAIAARHGEERTAHRLEIVQRLAHAHHHDVGDETVAFGREPRRLCALRA